MERGQTSSVRHARTPRPWPHGSSGRWLLTALLKNDVTTSESGHKGRAKNDAPHVPSHTLERTMRLVFTSDMLRSTEEQCRLQQANWLHLTKSPDSNNSSTSQEIPRVL